MKLELTEVKKDTLLSEVFGISEERFEGMVNILHNATFKAEATSDGMQSIAEACDNINELAYFMYVFAVGKFKAEQERQDMIKELIAKAKESGFDVLEGMPENLKKTLDRIMNQ